MSVSRLQKVGLALGASTFGTASGAFTRGLLVSEFNVTPSGGAGRVAEVRGTLATNRISIPPLDYDVSMKMPLDLGDASSANIGDILLNIMGTDTVAGSNPYTHTFTREDSATPDWHNLYSDKNAVNKEYRGFRANSVKFSIKGDASQIDVDVAGLLMTADDLAGTQSLTFSGSPLVLPSQASTFTIGGSAVANFDSVEITIFREYQRFHPIGNSRVITNAYGKTYGIDVALQGLDFANETERAKFLAATSSSLNLILTDANSMYLRFNLPEVYYSSWEDPAIADTDLLRVSAGMIVTDGSAPSVILQNARATAYSA